MYELLEIKFCIQLKNFPINFNFRRLKYIYAPNTLQKQNNRLFTNGFKIRNQNNFQWILQHFFIFIINILEIFHQFFNLIKV